jgi:hypothetical protein
LLKKEVAEIDADIDRYQRQFRDIREQCMLKVTNTIDDYIGGLAVKITKEQPIDNLVKAMVNDVKLLLETHIAKIKSLELTSLNCDTSEVIQAAIEKEASQIKGIADLTTDMATFALTLVLVFPVGAAATGTTAAAAGTTAAATATGATAAQMAARSSKAVGAVAKVSKFGKAAQALGNTAADTAGKAGKNTAKGGKYLKVLGKIGSVVKELNPLEKVKDVILPYFLNPRLSKLLGPKMAARLDLVFSEFELAINDEIDRQYLQPRRLKKELLTREYSNKAGARKSIDETRRSLEDDITEINRLLN